MPRWRVRGMIGTSAARSIQASGRRDRFSPETADCLRPPPLPRRASPILSVPRQGLTCARGAPTSTLTLDPRTTSRASPESRNRPVPGEHPAPRPVWTRHVPALVIFASVGSLAVTPTHCHGPRAGRPPCDRLLVPLSDAQLRGHLVSAREPRCTEDRTAHPTAAQGPSTAEKPAPYADGSAPPPPSAPEPDCRCTGRPRSPCQAKSGELERLV